MHRGAHTIHYVVVGQGGRAAYSIEPLQARPAIQDGAAGERLGLFREGRALVAGGRIDPRDLARLVDGYDPEVAARARIDGEPERGGWPHRLAVADQILAARR